MSFKHQPRKRFGQNFLVDTSLVAAIVATIAPASGENIVEIGPGLGALTRPLLAQAGRLQAIEIDRDLALALQQAQAPGLVIHATDVLKFDFRCLGSDLRVVGNLPYNISTPLLFHLAQFSAQIRDVHVMLQKEVVARMVAEPSDTDYGRLSVMLQYRFDMVKLLDVPAAAFSPQPKVESAVVRLLPRVTGRVAVRDEALLARVVAGAFSQRRKTLRNSLRAWLTAEDFSELAITPSMRAQEISVEQFAAIANYISARGR